jgi:hypothetical protein
VLLAVSVVPKGHDAKASEATGQVSDSVHPNADLMNPESAAVVLPVAFNQILESRDPLYLGARRVAHFDNVVRTAPKEYVPPDDWQNYAWGTSGLPLRADAGGLGDPLRVPIRKEL